MDRLGGFMRQWGLVPEMDKAYGDLKGQCMAQQVNWQTNADPIYPFVAQVEGKEWKLRVNNFPEEEHVYTLFIDKKAAFSFSEMPKAWKYPD